MPNGNEDQGSTVPRRRLGRLLSEYRDRAGKSQAEAARHLEVSAAKIYRLENGKISVKTYEAERLCKFYEVPENLTEVAMALASLTNVKGWWHSFGSVIPDWFDVYIGLESASERLRWYEAELVPGLLQTEAYARAVVTADNPGVSKDEITRRVQLRLNRQKLVTRRPSPLHVEVVLNEAVLRRPVGGAAVMAEQLQHFNDLAELPNVSIRVLPFDTELHAGVLSGPFVILDFPDGEPTTIYVEVFTGALYLEKQNELDRYLSAFSDIQNRARDEQESRDLIARAAKEWR